MPTRWSGDALGRDLGAGEVGGGIGCWLVAIARFPAEDVGDADELTVQSGNNNLEVAGSGNGDILYGPVGTNNVLAALGAGATIYAGGSGVAGTSSNDAFFLSTAGTSTLSGASADLTGTTVANFWQSDALDFTDINAATASLSFTQNQGGGMLTVTDGTNTASLELLGQFSASGFSDQSDGAAGTVVAYTPTQNQQPIFAHA